MSKSLHDIYLMGVEMWLVAPKDNEAYSTVVLAQSKEMAISKASKALEQYNIDIDSSSVKVLNLTKFFGNSGYDIIVAKKSTYH